MLQSVPSMSSNFISLSTREGEAVRFMRFSATILAWWVLLLVVISDDVMTRALNTLLKVPLPISSKTTYFPLYQKQE